MARPNSSMHQLRRNSASSSSVNSGGAAGSGAPTAPEVGRALRRR